MTPTPNSEISLHELNSFIAEQKNCAIDDLYTFTKGAPAKKEGVQKVEDAVSTAASTNEVLTDHDIARNFRSQADAMYKEAARLRKQADELDPPTKKAAKAKEAESA
jgi:hypothetical protein